MVVGVAVGGGDETEDIVVVVSLSDEGAEGVEVVGSVDRADRADRGIEDPEGLFGVVMAWAGPITCRKSEGDQVNQSGRVRLCPRRTELTQYQRI